MMRPFLPFLVLAALASGCSPAINLGSDELAADADATANADGGAPSDTVPAPSASADSAPADAAPNAPIVTTAFPRIDVRVVSQSRGWPVSGQLQDGVNVSVHFFKTPLSLTTDASQGPDGCVDRVQRTWVPEPDLGRTAVGATIGFAQATGRAAVPLVVNGANFYAAEMGVLPAGTEITLTFDASAPDIGGRTFKATTKPLDLVAATTPLAFTKGNPYSLAFSQDVEGPSYWSVSDSERIPGTGIAAHYVDCRSSAGVRATTIDTALFEGLDWSAPGTSGTYTLSTNVAPQTSKTASGATVNVFSQAQYASSFRVN